MADQKEKVKGTADIVFLVDSTGSMGPCIEAVKTKIGRFMDMLKVGDANNAPKIKHWRARVVGYRDAVEDPPEEWYVDNPFVENIDDLKGQANALEAKGGGEEAESLIDALKKLSEMEELPKGAAAPFDQHRWRYYSEAHRIIIIFTDASYKEPAADGATFDDLRLIRDTKHFKIFGLLPRMDCYEAKFAALPKSEFETLENTEGNWAESLAKLAESDKFEKILEAIAKTISGSLDVPVIPA